MRGVSWEFRPWREFRAEFVVVAAVSRARRDDDAGVVVGARLEFGVRAFLGGAVGVADLGRAEFHGGVHALREVAEFFGVGLDQEDVAALADRVRHLHVDRDLAGPVAFRFRKRRSRPFLVDLLEAAVFIRARRQAELFAVDREIGFGGRVVEGVDDGDGLRRAGGRFFGQRVQFPQPLRGLEAREGFRAALGRPRRPGGRVRLRRGPRASDLQAHRKAPRVAGPDRRAARVPGRERTGRGGENE